MKARADVSIGDVLRRRGSETPTSPAMAFSRDGLTDESLAFGDLSATVARCAHALLGVAARGDRVIVMPAPGRDFAVATLGCLTAGIVGVPASAPTSRHHATRLRGIIADAEPRALITTQRHLGRARRTAGDSSVPCIAIEDLINATDDERDVPAPQPDDMALIQYTSGSTTVPRGVALTHGNLMSNLAAIRSGMDLTALDRAVIWLPPYHDMGLIGGLLAPVFCGFPVTVIPPAAFADDPLVWVRAISRVGATVSGGPNFAYEVCAARLEQSQPRLDLSTWQVAFIGAEPIRASTLRRFAEAAKPLGFNANAFYPCYGLAEATLMVTGGRRGAGVTVRPSPTATSGGNGVVSCGSAVEGSDVRIIDPVRRTAAAPGQIGEIWVRGPGIATGYWQRGQGEGSFRAVAADDAEGSFLQTGDLGFVEGAELHVAGRLGDRIIVRGRNHYPADIESAVRDHVPDLRQRASAAVGVVDDDGERLVFLQEVRTDECEGSDALFAAIRGAIAAEEEVVPDAVVLVRVGDLPRTSSGKVQRYRCRDRYAAGELRVLAESTLPVSWLPAESSQIVNLVRDAIGWASGISSSELDADHAIEGVLDSLGALRARDVVQQALGIDLPPSFFLRPGTISDRAEDLAQRFALGVRSGLAAGVDPARTPLSIGQQAMVFLDALAPDAALHNLATAVELKGRLDLSALQQAFAGVVARHGILRSRLSTRDLVPHLELSDDDPPPLLVRHLTGDLDEALAKAAHRPFDLTAGPPVRAYLFALDDDVHVLLLVVHHLAADFWALETIAAELVEGYSQTARDGSVDRHGLESYARYVRWEQEVLDTRGDELLRYWADALAGVPPLLGIPMAPAPGAKPFEAGEVRGELPAELSGAVAAHARRLGVTVHTVLLSGFQLLLHRYSNQRQVVVGTPAANRERAEFADVVGLFMNPLPIVSTIDGSRSFNDHVLDAAARMRDALDHQSLPFASLVQAVVPDRDPSRSPVFQAMFILQAARESRWRPLGSFGVGEAAFEAAGLQWRSRPVPVHSTPLDLVLVAAETDRGLATLLRYRADVVPVGLATRLLLHFGELLGRALAAPDDAIDRLGYIPSDEARAIVAASRGPRAQRRPETVLDFLKAQAEAHPDRVAVRSGEVTLSFAQLRDDAEAVARGLAARGVAPGDRVALRVERSAPMVGLLFGILAAGAAYVPLNPLSPDERIRRQLADSGCRLLVTDGGAEPEGSPVPTVDASSLRNEDRSHTLPVVEPSMLAYVIFTSGSTGRPRGVMVSHASLANLIVGIAEEHEVGEHDVVLALAPLSFDMSVLEVFLSPCVGATLVIGQRQIAADGDAIRSEIALRDVSFMQATPTTWRLVAGETWSSPKLQVVCGGEAPSQELLEELAARARRVWNFYGPTEATVWASRQLVRENGRTVGVGQPLPNIDLFVVDDLLDLVPTDVPGQIAIAGDGLAWGYLGDPARTAERFVPNPFADVPGGRLYLTGDWARRGGDGTIEFIGRRDQQVKVRGFRVECGEVEAALRANDAVAEAVVVLREDRPGDQRLVAYVVPEPAISTSEERLQQALAVTLPSYMVPPHVVFLDRLPASANNKIDRTGLPPPKPKEGRGGAPATEVESLVAVVWSDVLGVELPSRDDDFFRLGGHSLLALEVARRVSEEIGARVPVRSVLMAPRLADFASIVADAGATAGIVGAAPPPIGPLARARLSPQQHRLWFLEQLTLGTSQFTISAAFRIRDRVESEALAAAVRRLVNRHDALRTVFLDEDGEPVQALVDVDPVVVLRDVSVARSPLDAARANVREAAATVFDLQSGPPFRLELCRLSDDDNILVVAMHHLITDATSMQILVREAFGLYEEEAYGVPCPLRPLTVSHGGLAEWQRARADDRSHLDGLDYWKAMLAGGREVDLRRGAPSQDSTSVEGAREMLTISGDEFARVRAAAMESGSTTFTIGLAAFALVLGHECQQDDVMIGTDVAIRPGEDAQSVVGFFVNQAVLRVDLSSAETVADVLDVSRRTVAGALAHGDVPFNDVVGAIAPPRQPGRAPLFEVKIVHQPDPETYVRFRGREVEILRSEALHVQNDLVFLLWESEKQLVVEAQYRKQVLDARRARRLLESFALALAQLTDGVDTRVASIRSALRQLARRQRDEERETATRTEAALFSSVVVELLTSHTAGAVAWNDGPGGIRQAVATQPDVDLARWLAAVEQDVRDALRLAGAVVFSGFDVTAPEHLGEAVAAWSPAPYTTTEHPRLALGANLYTPVDYAADELLHWHHEDAFKPSWPRHIWFCCLEPSAEGGETPTADGRQVHARLDPALVRRFEERGVMYVRRYGHGFGLPWQSVFSTNDPRLVEAACRGNGIEWQWRTGDRLTTRTVCPAVVRDPATGAAVWFAQIFHWHRACLREDVLEGLVAACGPENLPRDCYYGDGSTIEDSVVRDLTAAYRDVEVVRKWESGDVVLVDNLVTAHARRPYRGPRRLVVAMSDPTSFVSLVGR